ncbi:MAG: 3-deoxy-7-phosphoheptulonate synthase, partial [Betaproteobacteria bacterium]
MILVLEPNTQPESPDYRMLMAQLERLPSVDFRVHREVGSEVTLTEIYLIGNTGTLTIEQMQVLPCVEKVVRVSEAYRVLGRHKQGDDRPSSFEYNGVRFGQDSLNVFAGLCAVDSPESVEGMMKALRDKGQVCTRMGAYKPRTSPYAFQGFGAKCLPYVFELAGKYGIRVIAMEITHESHVDEIRTALGQTGNPTGVMLQIGTRNTQNFELLKQVGKEQEFPVLIKRGF